MFELRIVGETPAALLQNLQAVLTDFAATVTLPAATPVEDKFPASDNVGAETIAEPMENPKAGGKGKPGRKPKAQTIDAKANEPAELDKADFLDDEPKKPAKEVTVDDLKDAVRQALVNAQARAEAAIPNFKALKGKDLETANNKVQAEKVAYVKPLLVKFGAANVSSLKPEQYADFLEAAQAYISGEA